MNKFLRLTAIQSNGNRVTIVLSVIHIVTIAEHPEGTDQRPTTEIYMHGGVMFKVVESIGEIQRLMNTPESMGGAVINPQEAF